MQQAGHGDSILIVGFKSYPVSNARHDTPSGHNISRFGRDLDAIDIDDHERRLHKRFSSCHKVHTVHAAIFHIAKDTSRVFTFYMNSFGL